jgi:flagellin
MSFSVHTNNAAMAAIRTLADTNRQLDTTQSRINSGLKVASAKDDASTFSIAQGLRSDIAAFKAVSDALSFGQATTNVALKASETVSGTLNTMKAKIASAQASNVDRAAIQNDIDALVSQVGAIVDAAQFNGVNLLNGVNPDLNVLASLNRADASSAPTPYNITVAAQDITAATLGIDGINVTDGYATLAASADLAFAVADTMSFTVAGKTYTFEFVDDPATDALTAAENIAVDIDPAASVGENLAAMITVMEQEGFTVEYNYLGGLTVTHAGGAITVVTDTFATGDLDGTITAAGDPVAALATIENAITTVKNAMASFGTSVNQLETQSTFVKALQDTLSEGVGTLVDADLAEESAMLQAVQTRQQLGVQALSIANQAPQAILTLFRG